MQSVKGTAEAVKEGVVQGAQRVAAFIGGGGEPDQATDSASASRSGSEQEGHPASGSQDAGPLHSMKQSAVQALEGVKMRLHLGSPSNNASGSGMTASGDADTSSGSPVASAMCQRTGEPMHMAKAAEGRNQAQDNSVNHALHSAFRPEPYERPETSAFPETLGDALAVTQMRDLPNNPSSIASPTTAEVGDRDVEPATLNPFSTGARSKL
ncbi:hypothetical protein D9Q98_008183 [Chlorella vulgaris]|uniref:Uncharacterized protein n=1 Tax=Chlorella vulgaris TaxID=3077 RepID=A0A9D4TG56_CHLVU|nr:hypothetical protein D9Q98_008183 [Chlorella vulgaris]